MPRKASVWWRKTHSAWFTTFDGEQVNLGPDRKAADRAFHAMHASKGDVQAAAVGSPTITLARLGDQWLESCLNRIKPITWQHYQRMLQDFLDHAKNMKAAQLKPIHVTRWLDSKGWASSTQHLGATTVKLMFAWGHDQGLLPSNPLQRFRRPPMARRAHVPDGDVDRLLGGVFSQAFRTYVEMARETGCRPGELRRLSAADLNEDCTVARVTGKTGTRPVALSPRARQIVMELRERNPTGPLLRNTEGDPWTGRALQCAFRRAGARVGVKVCPHQMRGVFASKALKQGVDLAIVSKLLGHKSVQVTFKHYVTIDEQQLTDAIGQATGGGEAPRPQPDPRRPATEPHTLPHPALDSVRRPA
jgi:integrase